MTGLPGVPAQILAFLLAMGAAPVPAAGQANPHHATGEVVPKAHLLTLEEALERALRHNPEIRRARNSLELSPVAVRAAYGAFLPSFTLSAGTNLNASRVAVAEDFFGNPIENPELRTASTSASSQGISLGLPLFQGGRRLHQLRLERGEAAGREGEAAARLIAQLAGVERRFMEARRAEELLALEEEVLEERRRDQEVTRRLFRLAARSQVDVLGAELEVQEQERAVSEARGALRQSRLALRTVIGDVGLPPFVPAPVSLDPFDPGGLDVEALVRTSLLGHPRVSQGEAAVAGAMARAAAARAERYPTLNLNFNAVRSITGQDRSAFLDLNPDRSSARGWSLSMNLPLFSRFNTSQGIAHAEVGARNARESLRETELLLEEEVRSRVIGVERARESLTMAERSADLAERRLALAREQYRLAGSSFLELQQAASQSASARRALLVQRYTFAEARIALEEAVGAPVVPGSR